MKEYIEREAALSDEMCEGISCQECPFLIHPVNGGCKVVKYINGIPAADVVEVKRGEWVVIEDLFGEICHCSECGFFMGVNEPGNGLPDVESLKYCPNCGTRMDGGVNDERVHQSRIGIENKGAALQCERGGNRGERSHTS